MPGLTLRIIPGKAVWYVRRRETTLRLGEAQRIPLGDARYFAEQIRLAARRRVDLKQFAKVLVDLAPGGRRISSAWSNMGSRSARRRWRCPRRRPGRGRR
jgi:hypothetical protein